METRIEDIGTPPVPRVSDDGQLPEAWAPGPVDRKFLCERERARAEDAEARADAAEARWREVRARQRASSRDAVGKSSRAKLKAAREEVREVRRTAKRALALEREAARLGRLLAEAGVDARKRSTVMSLRMENAALKAEVRGLRDRVAALEARNEELRSSRSSMSKSMFGSKSEKRPWASSERKRGQAAARGARPSWPHAPAEARRDGGAAGPAGERARLLQLRRTCRGSRTSSRSAPALCSEGAECLRRLRQSPRGFFRATARMEPSSPAIYACCPTGTEHEIQSENMANRPLRSLFTFYYA
ncbi:MAG: hypothetical protein OXC26_09430 [Albidovulum sp.]|nr:hypothetical protein [Albidovulum sp.]